VADNRPSEIERLLGGGGGAIAEKYKAELQIEQAQATRDLKAAMDEAKRSADRYSRRLLVATWVLVALTAVLVILTVAVAYLTWHLVSSSPH
jgi:hypothetical protein